MGRRRPVDHINWRLYRRAWALCALALVVVLATSFRPQVPPQPALPPTFTNEQAGDLVARAARFDQAFPDRRAGTPGAVDSAQWVRSEMKALGLTATTSPTTTTSPAADAPVSLVNVEARLPGRTRETIVILSPRDNRGARDDSLDGAIGTVALVDLASDLAASHDRRRTFLLVSTDGTLLNGGGARALARRLARSHDHVVAVIALDGPGSAEQRLHVPFAPSGRYAPPLGLTFAALDAVRAEGGRADLPPIATQLLRLGMPVTLLQQGQLMGRGLPVTTISAVNERPQAVGKGQGGAPRASDVGDAVRALQRLIGTLDAVDTLESAGKTYVATPQRVYRGWALKILIATMLVPFWVAAVDMLVRMRHRWNMLAATGPVARAMIGGIVAVALLWALGGIGAFPASTDRPPSPDAVGGAPLLALALWLLLSAAAWLLARAPDWRRAAVRGRDHAVLVVAMLTLGVLGALALSVNPYAVLFALPALHAWLWLSSRHVAGTPAIVGVWLIGLVGPIAIALLVAATFDLGVRTPWYLIELVQTRTVTPALALLAACGGGIGILVLLAALGAVGSPALPRIRAVLQANGPPPRGTTAISVPHATGGRPRRGVSGDHQPASAAGKGSSASPAVGSLARRATRSTRRERVNSR